MKRFKTFVTEGAKKAEYIGNDVDSFRRDGKCINPKLPYNTSDDYVNHVDEYGQDEMMMAGF